MGLYRGQNSRQLFQLFRLSLSEQAAAGACGTTELAGAALVVIVGDDDDDGGLRIGVGLERRFHRTRRPNGVVVSALLVGFHDIFFINIAESQQQQQ